MTRQVLSAHRYRDAFGCRDQRRTLVGSGKDLHGMLYARMAGPDPTVFPAGRSGVNSFEHHHLPFDQRVADLARQPSPRKGVFCPGYAIWSAKQGGCRRRRCRHRPVR